ncbi:MAG: cytochrome c biogenesis protein CcsA [Archaeoglobus sp.]|nr:cytochrome c biogenesis protein CcsA [Archaeoglobus sp.]
MARITTAALIIFLIGLCFSIFAAYSGLVMLPESSTLELKNNYRILFFHLPSAITSFLAFTLTLVFSILYLSKRDMKYDVYAVTSAKAGIFLITAALISGSIWARVAWGSYWNWDPRETTVLILWFVYAAYFALRESIEVRETKAKNSAILAIFGYATIPLSYLSAYIGFSLHPSTKELKIGLNVGQTLGIMILGFILLYLAYILIESRAEIVKLSVEESEGDLKTD